MEEIGEMESKEEQINWFKFCYAIATVTVGLQDYVLMKIGKLWEEVSEKCRDFKCKGQCSQMSMCSGCNKWKDMILAYYNPAKNRNINWNAIDYSKWRSDPRELLKMFLYVHPKEAGKNHLSLDLINILSILENCTVFKIPVDNLHKLRKARNKKFSHNITGTLDRNELKKYLHYMFPIFHIEDVKSSNAGKKAFEKLGQIEKGEWEITINENGQENVNQNDDFELNILETLRTLESDQNDIKAVLARIDRSISKTEQLNSKSVCLKSCLGIFIAILTFAIVVRYLSKIACSETYLIPKNTSFVRMDCFKMQPSSFNEATFPYDKYLHSHKKFNRDWLRKVVENKLFQDNRGVLLSVETGFSTTSFIASLLCSLGSEDAGKIKTHTIAFHRCMYESKTTRKPEDFILNLANGLAHAFPEYRDYIENDELIKDLINEKCSDQIILCLDVVIISPFDELSLSPVSSVVVILDGLEKCNDASENTVDIIELLELRIMDFPPYIKFLITSAPISTPLNHLLEKIEVDLDSREHLDDVRLFLEAAVRQRKDAFRNLLADFKNNMSAMIQTIIKSSRGNVHFLLNWLKLKDLTFEQLRSQNVLYVIRFKQHFGSRAERYKETKILFEIIAASNNIISEEDLINVAHQAREQGIDFHATIYGITRQFIRISDGLISIQRSFLDWLLNKKNNEMFSLSIERGHALLVHHYFQQNPSEPICMSDAVSLIEHVVKARRVGLEIKFLLRVANDLKQFSVEGDFLTELLLNVPVMLDCYECVGLVFKLFDAENRSVGEKMIYKGIRDAGTSGNTESMKCFTDILYKQKVPENMNESRNIKAMKSSFIQEYVCPLLEIVIEHFESRYYEALEFEIAPKVSLANHYNLIMSSLYCNTNCIDELLGKGVHDFCLRCKEFNVIESRTNLCAVKHLSIIQDSASHVRQLMIDLCPYVCLSERLTFKTALHAAIATGHSQVAEKLLSVFSPKKKMKHTNCRSNGGWTPLLTSVRYDNIKSFKFLIKLGANPSLTCQLRESGICNVCPVKASVAHLVILYGAENILNHLLKDKQNKLDWNIRNQFNKATPIFYGMCSKMSKNILRHLPYDIIDVSARTDTGISVFHIAVLCKNFNALEYLHSKTGNIPEVSDNKGLGIFHYLYLEKRVSYDSERDLDIAIVSKIMALLVLNKHSFFHLDIYGRTFIHTAVLSSRFEELHGIIQKHTKAMLQLLKIKDYNGFTPLDVAINLMEDEPNNYEYKLTVCTLFRLIKYKIKIPSKSFVDIIDVRRFGTNIYRLLYLNFREVI